MEFFLKTLPDFIKSSLKDIVRGYFKLSKKLGFKDHRTVSVLFREGRTEKEHYKNKQFNLESHFSLGKKDENIIPYYQENVRVDEEVKNAKNLPVPLTKGVFNCNRKFAFAKRERQGRPYPETREGICRTVKPSFNEKKVLLKVLKKLGIRENFF